MTGERTARPAACAQGQTAAAASRTACSVVAAVDVFPPRGESTRVDVTEQVMTEGLYAYGVWAEVIKVSGNMHY